MRAQTVDRPEYLTAKEATSLLGVKPETLYAYVSRGWVRSVPQPGAKRRLYLREDVEKVKAKSLARSGHGVVAASALRWGEPVIHSSVTEVVEQGPRYRNRLAIDLARGGCSFEATAELLWSGMWPEAEVRWPIEPPALDLDRLVRAPGAFDPRTQILHVFSLVTQAIGMSRGASAERMLQGNAAAAARQLIHALAGCFGYLTAQCRYVPADGHFSVAQRVARSVGLAETPELLAALNAALVLCADNELTASTFSARVAASTGADLHSCIAAAICAHSGGRVGRGCDQAEDLLMGSTSLADFRKRLLALQQASLDLPGFNHGLYPKGDVRADYLIELALNLPTQTREAERLQAFLQEAHKRFGALPNAKVGLVVLARALGLPPRSASALFTLARIAGWVAHVLEQRLSGFLIRPRAKYLATEG